MTPDAPFHAFCRRNSLVTVLVVLEISVEEEVGAAWLAGDTTRSSTAKSRPTGSRFATFPAVHCLIRFPVKKRTGMPSETANSMPPNAPNTMKGPRRWIQAMIWLEKKKEMKMRSDDTVTSTGPAHCG